MLAPYYGLRPPMPIAAGGVTPGLVGALVSDYGRDIAIGAGGSVFGHPSGARAGARAFRQAIDCMMEGRDLHHAAQEHQELLEALEMWGAPDNEH